MKSDFHLSSIPTVGYTVKEFRKGHVSLKWFVCIVRITGRGSQPTNNLRSWDLAGQPRFRTIWERYCQDVNAIMYEAP